MDLRGTARRWRMVVVLSCIATALTAVPAGADPGIMQLDGVGVYVDECDGRSGLFTIEFVEGSLIGCWYVTDITSAEATPSGVYIETGTEEFVGCLHDDDGVELTCGSFTTEYRFVGKFASDGSEIHGRCQHPLTGGDGGFSGATGRVDLKDDVVAGEFLLRGHLDLG